MHFASLLALALGGSSALAQYKGFNYGSTSSSGAPYTQQDFEGLFRTAQGLVGTSGFSSARLYTMIQGGTADTIISAIPAAISTKTTLLLGLWASSDQATFNNELTALRNTVTQFGSQLAPLLAGISVGSEDLYRISPPAFQQGEKNPGQSPDTLINYIGQVRSILANTPLSAAPVGHVDTWTAWVNGSNSAVANAVDWVGVDAYPYFQNTQVNGIDQGASLFQEALTNTENAVNGKPVWVTETGWPVSGPTQNLAVPSTANAVTYWDQVGCNLLFGKYNTWWYTLQDAPSSPSFGVVGQTLSTTPLYNLSCSAKGASSSSSASSSTSTSASAASASATTQASATASAGSTASGAASGGSSVQSSAASASGSNGQSAPSSAPNSYGSSQPTQSGPAASSPASSDDGSVVYATATVTNTHTAAPTAGQTLTDYETTLVTVTKCETSYSATGASSPASPSSSAVKTTASAPAPSASSSGACPADINGDYQYPHLIVPVSSSSPSTAYGTQYNGTVNSTVSTIFTFDIPASYAGKQCSLIFLFPEQSKLETSAYTFNGQGGLVSHVLSSTANQSTTFANKPTQALQNGAISSLQSGNSYVISSDKCPANTAVSFELSSSGGLALEFFEDYNPSPLGLYVRAC